MVNKLERLTKRYHEHTRLTEQLQRCESSSGTAHNVQKMNRLREKIERLAKLIWGNKK